MRTAPARIAVAAFIVAGLAGSVGAQQPAAKAAPQTPPVTAPPPTEERPAYDAAGRRDPFVSLARTGTAPGRLSDRPAGIRGVLIAEVSVRGIVESKGRFLATVVSPDKRTYTISNGDQLFDGSVKVISEEAVVFLQDVTDPLSPIKQREIRKTIRTTEENR